MQRLKRSEFHELMAIATRVDELEEERALYTRIDKEVFKFERKMSQIMRKRLGVRVEDVCKDWPALMRHKVMQNYLIYINNE